jgi:TPP-dependent pyruvate/acetoin dehydrogenase alpha subunit
VLFICENNLYAMGTRIERELSRIDLADHVRAYGMPADVVDGMDVLAVEAAASRAAGRVRAGGGPAFLECRTYRFRAHSMFDAELYRDKAEVEDWKVRDPILRLRAQLEAAGALDAVGFAGLDQEAAREVAHAVAFAEAGTWEPVGHLTHDVYTPRGAATAPAPGRPEEDRERRAG